MACPDYDVQLAFLSLQVIFEMMISNDVAGRLIGSCSSQSMFILESCGAENCAKGLLPTKDTLY
jgi:hypothetical protein